MPNINKDKQIEEQKVEHDEKPISISATIGASAAVGLFTLSSSKLSAEKTLDEDDQIFNAIMGPH